MKILFIHQNFPAQFRLVAETLAADPSHEVRAIGSSTAVALPRVGLTSYALPGGTLEWTHPFGRIFDLECRRAEQVMYVCAQLKETGFVPDTVVVHTGWGEALPIRTLFPSARIVAYCEMFYREEGGDAGFDPDTTPPLALDALVGLRTRNASGLISLVEADIGISPTVWQQRTYPPEFRDKIHVAHDGIDTQRARPDYAARLTLPGGEVVRKGDDIVTFVSRNLEPLRGYHIFMRAIGAVLAERPRARVLIVGGDQVSYGSSPPEGRSWKEIFLEEVRGSVDLARIHFLGRLDYERYLRVLQVSAVHVYLTYPFVLSWSLLEALSAECAVVASATPPVQEVVNDANGRLVDFFDVEGLAATILDILGAPRRFADMRREARRTILDRYDRRLCVPALIRLFQG